MAEGGDDAPAGEASAPASNGEEKSSGGAAAPAAGKAKAKGVVVKGKRRFRRRRRARDASSDEEEADGGEGGGKAATGAGLSVAELRADLEKRERGKRAGLDAEALARGDALTAAMAAQVEAEAAEASSGQPASEWDKADAKKKLDQLLDGSFTAQAAQAAANAANPAMEAYIAERMGPARPPPEAIVAGAPEGAAPARAGGDEEAALYRVPDEIARITETSAAAGDAAEEDDVGEGGALLHGSGLAEVALPVDFKLANIEETERARRAFLEQRQREYAERRNGGAAAALAPGSFSANFKHHQREWAVNLKSQAHKRRGDDRGDAGGGGGGGVDKPNAAPTPLNPFAAPKAPTARAGAGQRAGRGGGGGGRGRMSSDDAVMDRFRKRMRR